MREKTFTPVAGLVVIASLTFGVVMAAALLGVFDGVAKAGDLPAAAQQMSVFKAAPVQDNVLPKAITQARDRLVTKGGLGSVMPNETRLLGTNLGRNRVATYAFPATGGAVCEVVAERTSVAMCVPSGLEGFDGLEGGVAWGIYSGEGVPQTVYGLASDAVGGVNVVVDGLPYEATLARNNFFWQAEAGVTRESIQALVVRQVDGGDVRVNLDFSR
jgi:hypothetical protein